MREAPSGASFVYPQEGCDTSIRRLRTAVLIAAFAVTAAITPASATMEHHRHQWPHVKGCHSYICDKRVGYKWAITHRPKLHRSAHFYINGNVTCYHEGSITASGSGVFVGEVANNSLPLGTKIRLDHAVFGVRDFVVLDHIGSGSELDIYGPSQGACEAFGRQSLGFWTIHR